MSRQLANVLRELRRDGDDWTFQTPTVFRIDRHNLGKLWRDFLTDAELRPIRFHDLRHTFATIHLQLGAPPCTSKSSSAIRQFKSPAIYTDTSFQVAIASSPTIWTMVHKWYKGLV
jgi:integrase